MMSWKQLNNMERHDSVKFGVGAFMKSLMIRTLFSARRSNVELLETDGLAVGIAQFDNFIRMRDAPQRTVVQRDFELDEAVVGARRRIEDNIRNGFWHVAFDGGNFDGDFRAEAIDGFEFGAAGRVGDAAKLFTLFEESTFDGGAWDDVMEAVEQHGTP